MDPGGAHKFFAAGATAVEADLQDRDDTHWQRTQQPGWNRPVRLINHALMCSAKVHSGVLMSVLRQAS